jgi:hypothetical protein
MVGNSPLQVSTVLAASGKRATVFAGKLLQRPVENDRWGHAPHRVEMMSRERESGLGHRRVRGVVR